MRKSPRCLTIQYHLKSRLEQQYEILAGRYSLYDLIASGGMATVHLARQQGQVGFARTVAVKRMHAHFVGEPHFRAMFIDEARLASHIRHPNVVQTLDVVEDGAELFIVMEYVHGLPLSKMAALAKREGGMPLDVACQVISGALSGLHSAHEATTEDGQPLNIVHRDVSPQNIIVGTDGVARLIDFGVAKALSQLHTTREGQLKGKLAYMAPEQVREGKADRLTDVFSMAVVLWEVLAGRRLFKASNDGELIYKLLEAPIQPPSHFRRDVPPELDAVILKGLARDREERFPSARALLLALEKAAPVVSQRAVAEWVQALTAEVLEPRSELLRSISRSSITAEAEARRSIVPDEPATIALEPTPSVSGQRLSGAPSSPSFAASAATGPGQTRTLALTSATVPLNAADSRGTLTDGQVFLRADGVAPAKTSTRTLALAGIAALIGVAALGVSRMSPSEPAPAHLNVVGRTVAGAMHHGKELARRSPAPTTQSVTKPAAKEEAESSPAAERKSRPSAKATWRKPAPQSGSKPKDYRHLYKRE